MAESTLTLEPAACERPAPAAEVRAPSLRRNFAWVLGGNVVYAGCQWGALVVLARLGDAAMVGAFALALALTAPVFMFANLNLRGVQVTDARGEYRFADYLGLRLLTTLVALAVIVGLALTAGRGGRTAAVIALLGLAKGFEAVSDVFYGLMQRHERMDRLAWSLSARGVLSVVALSAGVWLTGELLWGAAALAAGWGLVLVGYDMRGGFAVRGALEQLWPSWEWGQLGRLARQALPLGVVMFLISLNTNLPRYFVERDLGLTELGIFSALWYLTVAGTTIELAIGHAAYPRLAALFAAGDRRGFAWLVLRMMGLTALLGVAGVVGAVVLGRLVLGICYGPEYAAHADLLAWLLAGAGLGYMASQLNFAMTAARYFAVQAPLLVAVNAVTLAGCVLLVPAWGLYGAALALVGAAAFQLAGASLITAYILRRGAQS
ncbi:MAG: lipopolysaccharide biosynthesis protein [Gemmataceae bacterium]|nr:lipopolysaccharide biosynthesis protein [Gemmataceae bacterium]